MDFFTLLTKLLTCFNCVVSLPIYLSVLAFLCRQRHRSPFTSSFYTLFIALGFVDLSKFLMYIVKKCSYWGCVPAVFYPANQANRAANLLYFFVWALCLIQFQLNFLMSLNRLGAICCSHIYRCHWTPKITRYLLAFVFSVALLISAPILWQSVCFRSIQMSTPLLRNGGQVSGPVFMDISTQMVYYNVTKVFAISHLLFLLIAYPLMCRKIRQVNMKLRSQIAEIRMCYALVLPSIANLLFAIYLITWDILSSSRGTPVAERASALSTPPIAAEWGLLLVVVDFYDMNSPYGLIITSAVVRKYTLPSCCCCYLLFLWRRRRCRRHNRDGATIAVAAGAGTARQTRNNNNYNRNDNNNNNNGPHFVSENDQSRRQQRNSAVFV